MFLFLLIHVTLSSFETNSKVMQSINVELESTACSSVLDILLQVESPLNFCTYPKRESIIASDLCSVQTSRINGSIDPGVLALVCSKLRATNFTPSDFLKFLSSKVVPLNLAPSEIGSEQKLLHTYLSFNFIRQDLHESIKQKSDYYENWPKMLAFRPLENSLEKFPLTFTKPDEPYKVYRMSGVIVSDKERPGNFINYVIPEKFDRKMGFNSILEDTKPDLIFYSCRDSAVDPWKPAITFKPVFLNSQAGSIFDAAMSLRQLPQTQASSIQELKTMQVLQAKLVNFSSNLSNRGLVSGISVRPAGVPEEIIGQVQSLISAPANFCRLASNSISRSHGFSDKFYGQGILCLFQFVLTALESTEDVEKLRPVQTRS
jgi:hypothetical protein